MPRFRDSIPFVLLLGICGGVALGQSKPEGFLTEEESLRNAIYPAAVLDMVSERLTSPATPAAIPGLVRVTLPGAEDPVSRLASALAEDAGYRTGQMIESIASLGFEPLRIIDGDWTRVENAQVTPYKAICHIECTWFDGSTTHGTAFFIGPRVLITNAHLVWRGDKPSHIPLGIEVSPGRQGYLDPFGTATARHYWVPFEWSHGGYEHDPAYDIAWLILDDRTLYKRVGYHFGYQATTDAQLKSWNLNISGYPMPTLYRFQQYRDYETKNQLVRDSWFRHYLDMRQGSSGSPLYVIRDGKRFAVGVNCAESTGTTKYNVATRMTKHFVRDSNYLTELYK